MQLLFIGGGQEKSYHFFLLLGTPCKQAIANKAAKISDLALLLYAVITYSYMLYILVYIYITYISIWKEEIYNRGSIIIIFAID